jgi:hypothetical protein
MSPPALIDAWHAPARLYRPIPTHRGRQGRDEWGTRMVALDTKAMGRGLLFCFGLYACAVEEDKLRGACRALKHRRLQPCRRDGGGVRTHVDGALIDIGDPGLVAVDTLCCRDRKTLFVTVALLEPISAGHQDLVIRPRGRSDGQSTGWELPSPSPACCSPSGRASTSAETGAARSPLSRATS